MALTSVGESGRRPELAGETLCDSQLTAFTG